MTSSTETSVAARDGTDLLVREWQPSSGPRAGVLIVHGLGEHSGRYEHVGGWLADAGYLVHAYDHRGCGAFGGRRAYVERWSELHDDLEDRLAALRAAVPGLPVVLYGHSLGGLVSTGYLLSDRPKPDLAVLSAPALDSAMPSWRRAAAGVLGRVAPTLEVSNGFDGSVLSRDPSVAERYLADERNHHRTTARFGAEAFAEQARIRRAEADGFGIPTLVIHGGADRLVPPQASEPLAGRTGVERRVYPDHRHELHNEPDGDQILADVIAWLEGRLEPLQVAATATGATIG